MKTQDNILDELKIEHREIRNLRNYSDIWGEDCPTSELPYLIVFRGNDFEDTIQSLLKQAELRGKRESAEYFKKYMISTSPFIREILNPYIENLESQMEKEG